ncbi:MAG: aspartate--tRNA ligase [Gemmatimonadota bacterium]|jgi:aspartyl-tRNA synthetase
MKSGSQKEFEGTAYRTRLMGGVTGVDAGSHLVLCGWVHRRRDLGGLYFIDLRDRSGVFQVSVGPDWTDAESLGLARDLGAEDVVEVEGEVVLRPPEAQNPEMATGEVELKAATVRLLNKAVTPAIPVFRSPEEELPSEDLRLRHRVLDLRREEMQRNLELRHRLVLGVRNYMHGLGFVEVETPILTKPTPEGARDYLVPSRNHPGEFFALPQSPQLYKQLLVTSGVDRYLQIARCFRDEDLRADRQPEFTQIDVEAAFIQPSDLFGWIEGLMASLASLAGRAVTTPFPKMTYREALESYGSDRPDLRFSLKIQDWSEALRGLDFRVIQGALDAGGRARGYLLAGGASLSRREIEGLEALAKKAGAPGLLWTKRTEDGGSGPLARFMAEEDFDALGLKAGDLALVAAGPDSMTSPALDAIRVPALTAVGVEPAEDDAWLWVVDFPIFDVEEDGTLTPAHHPFVHPHPEDADLLEGQPEKTRGQAYDLVFNGVEFGSGSIRNHRPEVQRTILRHLGMSEEEIDHKFGFLLEALTLGAPPHGGIALGMDRIVKEFLDAPSLRDVIAFPKTTAARALFEGAPIPLSDEELRELHLRRWDETT